MDTDKQNDELEDWDLAVVLLGSIFIGEDDSFLLCIKGFGFINDFENVLYRIIGERADTLFQLPCKKYLEVVAANIRVPFQKIIFVWANLDLCFCERRTHADERGEFRIDEEAPYRSFLLTESDNIFIFWWIRGVTGWAKINMPCSDRMDFNGHLR